MAACPKNAAIRYNGSQCACGVGQLLNRSSDSCGFLNLSSAIVADSVVDYYSTFFPETMFDFESIRKFARSQALFLEATLVMLLSWLGFCFALRFFKVGDGTNLWFRIRWWISRLDVCFATRHWLDDQKVLKKRKTELGGAFSVASWMLFIGLFAALLYQTISRRTIEVHNVRATNAPDLATFINDMELNITTISSMRCSNLRGLGTLITGSPGFNDQRVGPLSDFVNYSCQNTSVGPTINFKCTSCRLNQDFMYISWAFVDLPNNPATAVGFLFNFTVKNHGDKKHVSFVGGILKNRSTFDDRPVTFRGIDTNILKFNLFPRIYRNLHDLKLIQPLFHEFIPGSFCNETIQLQSSLQNSNEGVVNTTLSLNYLSTYMVEIENQNIMGPVSFLADLGGLYCISIGIFFYFLVQCEYRIKKLRNEDAILRGIRNRRKAQEHWDKLRKYVMYTWGCSTLGDDHNSTKKRSSCGDCIIPSIHSNGLHRGSRSVTKQRQLNQMDTISFKRKRNLPSEKTSSQESTCSEGVKSSIAGIASYAERKKSGSLDKSHQDNEVLGYTNDGKRHSVGFNENDVTQTQSIPLAPDDIIPPPHPPELKAGSEVDMYVIQKNFERLYHYNVMLREKLEATQSLLHALGAKSSSLTGSQRCFDLGIKPEHSRKPDTSYTPSPAVPL
ncbi:hypothetical protein CFOL_v3_23477 [Cephalotus follicularis]|uniref:Transmembrane protein n=1 Tax=Cephalotus follicularis TaxID=3775 RepID=A0A1Q3CIG5_CEPFO|nr:hypothetical protein CFOL_v3_23477 [Cephalotus follicularis]